MSEAMGWFFVAVLAMSLVLQSVYISMLRNMSEAMVWFFVAVLVTTVVLQSVYISMLRNAIKTRHGYGPNPALGIKCFLVKRVYSNSELKKSVLASTDGESSFKAHQVARVRERLAHDLANSDFCSIEYRDSWVDGYTEVIASVRTIPFKN